MLYEIFKKQKWQEKTDFLKIYRFEFDGVKYKIGVTRKRANKRTRIVCQDNSVKFIRRLLLKPMPFIEYTLTNTAAFFEPDTVHIIVISGKPDGIAGLDDGVFASAKKFAQDVSKFFVIRKKVFKNLKV